MKTDFRRAARRGWQLIAAVPGWPDAPYPMRARRALPVLLPCLGVLLIAGWEFAADRPRARAERAASEPLTAAEAETTALQLKWSEHDAAALAAQAANVSHGLLPNAGAAPAALAALATSATQAHWPATFRAVSSAAPEIAAGSPIGFLTARGKMTPAPENGQPFSSLLSFLAPLETNDSGIDLTRLAIRADEEGRYTVETNLRLAYRISP